MNTLNPDIRVLLEIIERQAKEIEYLKARIAELERRLNQNSGNSSKPPSSDGLKKPPRTASLRESGKGRSGGQREHKGKTLKQVEHPDHVVTHALEQCPCCGESLTECSVAGMVARQVFDIPAPTLEVTEHRAESKYCACCKKTVTAAFPESVKAPVQYGNRIRSWANQHFIPEDRLQQLFMDMYGISLATASIASFNAIASANLARFEAATLAIGQSAPVKHLDETGFRVGGKTQWLHTLSGTGFTYYHVSEKRKSLLKGLQGTVVHDHCDCIFSWPVSIMPFVTSIIFGNSRR